MANYSLVINSKFKPFSYQELLQPALMSTQAHQAVEEAYADLATKASIWDKMANESTDPKAHAIYKKYADDLQAQSEELSRYGLTPASRQSMLNMRSRYARDITPIETAYKRREEQMKQQNAILAQDPTHMFARRAAETSLDAFLEQPTLDTIAQNYSGSLLTKQVSDAAAALAKDARNDPNVQTELRKLLPYQYETIRRTGFAPEAVRQAILNSPNADKILTGLVDTAMANSGMNDWNYTSPEEKARIIAQARNYANQGLWSAVGQTQYGNVSDSYGMQSALEAQRHRHAMAEAAAKKKAEEGSILPYRRIANSRVLEANTTQLNADLKFLQKLSKTDVTKLSKKAPQRSITSYEASIGAPSASSDYDRTWNNYKRIAKEYGINVKGMGPNGIATLIKKVENKINQNVQRAQTYQLNMTDQSQVAQILQENSNTFSIKDRSRSGFNEIDDKGKVTKHIDAKDAAKIFEKGKDFNLSYDPSGGFQLSYRDGNEFKTVNIEPELLNFGDEDYTLGHKYVNQYMNSGREDYANSLIDEMMTGLYYRFNTQAKKESTTDSKLE